MTMGCCFAERTLWHSTDAAALFLRPGGWVQPPAGGDTAETPETKRRFKNLPEVSGLWRKLAVETADPICGEVIRRIHPDSYLTEFKHLSDADSGILGEESPFGHGGHEIAARSAGPACHAMDRVLTGAWRYAHSLSRPPGHPCMPDHSMGFRLLANIPVAIKEMKVRHGLGRVAVVDRDVHHGNGMQANYRARGDVLTLLLHRNARCPVHLGTVAERGAGAGTGADINIPLLPGGGHISCPAAMDRIVLPAPERFRPEPIGVASGLDANGIDPLARMMAHSGTCCAMTARLMQAADALFSGRLVVVHEGGCSEVLFPFCGHAIMEALSGQPTEVIDPLLCFPAARQPPPEFDALEARRLDGMARDFGL